METSEQPQSQPSPELEEEAPLTLADFLVSPKVQEAISQIPSLISQNIDAKTSLAKIQIEAQTGTTQRATKGLFIWTAILVALIVIPVSILAWFGKMSSDAATFLFGAIVGAAFTFLRNFFPRGA